MSLLNVEALRNFQGVPSNYGKGFLIDATVFFGNSGGPVFYVPPITIEENGLFQVNIVDQPMLVRIEVSAVAVALGPEAVPVEVGLHYVVPTDAIVALLESDKVRAS